MNRTESVLERALLAEGEMHREPFEGELDPMLGELRESMHADRNDFIFTVTEIDGSVAMVLVESSGTVRINEDAREWLRSLWGENYEPNLRMFIPSFARELDGGEIPLCGVTIVDRADSPGTQS